jgi:hypothetical protein
LISFHAFWTISLFFTSYRNDFSHTNKMERLDSDVSRRIVMGCSCRPSGSLWVGIVETLKNWNWSLRKSLVSLIKMDVFNKMVVQGYNRNIDNECWLMNKQKDVDVPCTNAVGTGR